MERGNWADNPCWYCSIIDGKRTGLVLGPFRTESGCREYAYRDAKSGGDVEKHDRMIDAAYKADPKSWFYSWGMVKMATGHRDGVLNRQVFGEDERDLYGHDEVKAA